MVSNWCSTNQGTGQTAKYHQSWELQLNWVVGAVNSQPTVFEMIHCSDWHISCFDCHYMCFDGQSQLLRLSFKVFRRATRQVKQLSTKRSTTTWGEATSCQSKQLDRIYIILRILYVYTSVADRWRHRAKQLNSFCMVTESAIMLIKAASMRIGTACMLIGAYFVLIAGAVCQSQQPLRRPKQLLCQWKQWITSNTVHGYNTTENRPVCLATTVMIGPFI